MNIVSPLQLAARLRESAPPRLLDVREPEELAIAALPGALHIPLGELAERIDELEAGRDLEWVVICHHGVRSAMATGFLAANGFSRAINLSGGIDRWSLEVDPGVPRY
jgi:rhodanese-related sulfurtransferase